MTATLEGLNKFTAETVAEMDDATRAAWEAMSEGERKATAAAAYFFMIETSKAAA